jgi:hypothetical protein
MSVKIEEGTSLVRTLFGAIGGGGDMAKEVLSRLGNVDPRLLEQQLAQSGYVGTPNRVVLGAQPAATGTNPAVGASPPNAATVKQPNARVGNGYSELKPEHIITMPDGKGGTIERTGAQIQKHLDEGLKGAGKAEVREHYEKLGITIERMPEGVHGKGIYSFQSSREIAGDPNAKIAAALSSAGGNNGSGNGTPSGGPALSDGTLPLAIMAFVQGNGGSAAGVGLGAALGAMTGSGLAGVAGGAWGLGTNGTGGSLIGAGGLGVMATAAGLAGQSGLSMNLRHQMQSVIRQEKTNDMIGMLDNPGIPIEDLLMYFMAFMTDQYDKRLREKMKEMAEQEKLEQRMANRDKQAQLLGGLVSMVPVVGPAVGAIAGQVAMTANQADGAVNGTGKSSTLLQAEIQVLSTRWKNLSEMVSNFYKAMADMAQTIIRNIR